MTLGTVGDWIGYGLFSAAANFDGVPFWAWGLEVYCGNQLHFLIQRAADGLTAWLILDGAGWDGRVRRFFKLRPPPSLLFC